MNIMAFRVFRKALLCGKCPQNEIFIGILKLNNHDF